jgi:tetratricopeptide (TPR) repeat protein
VLTAVNERALAHYQGQDLDELGPDALERRARILHAMGEDDEKRGLTDRALAQFQEAARTTAALLAENPSAPHRIYAHAQSEYWLGYIAYSKSDWRRAGTHWKRYKELGLHLEAADRSNPDWLREAAYGDGNLCTLHLTAKASPADALASCSAALAKMRAVHGVSGGNDRSTRDLANRHAWMADAYFFAGRSDEALKSRRLQEKLLEPLVRRTPQDASLLDQWMRTLMATAELLLKTGNRTQADNYARRAREVATRLIRHDPANAAWQKWLSRIDKISSRDVGERQW